MSDRESLSRTAVNIAEVSRLLRENGKFTQSHEVAEIAYRLALEVGQQKGEPNQEESREEAESKAFVMGCIGQTLRAYVGPVSADSIYDDLNSDAQFAVSKALIMKCLREGPFEAIPDPRLRGRGRSRFLWQLRTPDGGEAT